MASSPGISAFPEADNLLNWVGTITGAPGTVRAGFVLLPYASLFLLTRSPLSSPGLRRPDLQALDEVPGQLPVRRADDPV